MQSDDAPTPPIGLRIYQLRTRRTPRLTQQDLAERAGVSVDVIQKLEQGRKSSARLPTLTSIATALGVDLSTLLTSDTQVQQGKAEPSDETAPHIDKALDVDGRHLESLRQGLNDALSDGTMAEASLDDWERAVLRYGRATRDRPAGMLVDDLSADLAELRRVLQRHRSASALRRLTRVAAHMSGLMCLTFCKLDDRPAFRRWARTARLAADEAGDPEARSWVLAQEAYGHYYSADLLEAIDVASHAQAIVAATPCVGSALAAALEARAHAALRRNEDTRAALGRAEDILSHLGGDALTPSAFGYTEAQLRFHEGSAYTHLGDVRAAFAAQARALELCAPGDYTDWAMTRLDRTRCLAAVGDTVEALDSATETLTALTEPRRRGIITLRGNEILSILPNDQRALPAARNLHELLTLTTEQREVQRP